MNAKDKHERTLTIMEAVETLSRIADMDLDHDLSVVSPSEAASEEPTPLGRNVEWLNLADMESTVESVRETFRVILNYLRQFYKKESGYVARPETTEGIKTIMVLVGEAAKKLDKYSSLFHHATVNSITDLKEYKQLQEFYISRVAHKVDEGMLGKWLIALTQRMLVPEKPIEVEIGKSSLANHIFVDLDAVKKDSEYELFFIRKEDGTRFFSPRLIRNIKLVCDFGEYLTESKVDDPLESVLRWQDHSMNVAASQLLKSVNSLIESFYKRSPKVFSGELCEVLSKAMIALMLSSHANNLVHDLTLKNCLDYFTDFQFYLREALSTREYQKLIAYPPKKSDVEPSNLLELTHSLCYSFFSQTPIDPEAVLHINHLIAEAKQDISSEHLEAACLSNLVWNQLACSFGALSKMIKRHSNGPLLKVLDLLEDGSYNAFDPIWQNNIPHQLFALFLENRKITNLYLPSPTHQEFINKVFVVEEFKGFLRAMSARNEQERHLLVNMQDRTSWREHSRCAAVEELQNLSDFENQLTVVTLAKDTEFYFQEAPYDHENHADVFKKLFNDQLFDEGCGYYFPEKIKAELFPEFVENVINGIHRVFFAGKNVLSVDNRMNFIEIFYSFLQMKLIELVKPSSISMTCKDGLDIGAASNAQLFAFLKFLSEEEFSQRDYAQLNYMVYGPSIMIRERVMLAERFTRLQNAIKTIELVKQEFGPVNFVKIVQEVFGRFYKFPIVNVPIVWPES